MVNLDLVSELSAEERVLGNHRVKCVSPDDAKYGRSSSKLSQYLSADAEWRRCAAIQRVLLQTRVEFGQAEERHVREVTEALERISPLNMSLLEDKVTRHDQLAVIEEIGRFVSPETKALLHPGTTSYDILDTARAHLFRQAWNNLIRPEVAESVKKLCGIAERSNEIVMVGRTHLQNTSPITFGLMFAGYAARLAERVVEADRSFSGLRGKVSGIVGTGASVDMVVGEGKSVEFEKAVLMKLGLEPDYTATQVVQKERMADVGHSLTTLVHVLGDFANDIRILYSSAINEVTSRDNSERLGGSSADATKDNPIAYENIAGKAVIVESGMRILYAMISSDLQRDLRGSVQGRYQPQLMMVETYEAFERVNKALGQLSINEDAVQRNLVAIRNNPSEAMVAILRGRGWVHSKYGVGHDFVKRMGIKAKKEGKNLLDISLQDPEFGGLYDSLPANQRNILNGDLENYLGSTKERTQININYARGVVGE